MGEIRHIFNKETAPFQSAVPTAFTPAADVVIIGGGYTGLSAALHLAQMSENTLAIVVLEATHVGAGASGKSGGHVGPDFQEHDEKTVLKLFRDPAAGQKALDIIQQGPAIVSDIIADKNIDCDMRKGYVLLTDGKQVVDTGGAMFGIEPYPFVLGLAKGARELGVKIYERSPALDISDAGDCFIVKTPHGSIRTKEVLCAGGQRMTENISFLKPLRRRTIELFASTIITDPLPAEVIQKILPDAGGKRYPFATDKTDVAYGTIDREGRIIFGACTGVLNAGADKIARALFSALPDLQKAYADATGKELTYRKLVDSEPIDFTADLLPHAGRMGKSGGLRYIHALGGHGIALGTVLGRVAAEDIYGHLKGIPSLQENFNLFARVKHMRLPTWKPLRKASAYIAVETVKVAEKIRNFFS